MIASVFKGLGFSFVILVLGEMVTLGGRPVSHHAVESVHWTTHKIQESGLWKSSAEWIRDQGYKAGTWAGHLGWKSSSFDGARTNEAGGPEQITTADRQALRDLIRSRAPK